MNGDNPSICTIVAERIALGEPLGEHAAHAASCARCQRAAALPHALGASKAAVDPGIGFSARVSAGAQHRLVVRQRRRVVGTVAATALVAVLGVFAVTHEPDSRTAELPSPDRSHPATQTDRDRDKSDHPDRPDPWKPHDGALDPDVAALVHLARNADPNRGHAKWHRFEKSLAAYRALVKETTP